MDGMKNKWVDALNSETSQIKLLPVSVVKLELFMMAFYLGQLVLPLGTLMF